MQRWLIRINGVVQGVGFRPFVYGLARRLYLNGWVRNDSHGVLIEVDGDEAILATFISDLSTEAPPLAKINKIELLLQTVVQQTHFDFQIIKSQLTGIASTMVPVDSHVCDECLREINDPQDRRYQYPFINCTHCGPRFSIIKHLPYDRGQTTMASFVMCDACQSEYENPLSRRYHAQPIACPKCGPQLQWLTTLDSTRCEGAEALQHAREALKAGKIIAIKSVGGFHLAVNAHDAEAVAKLRARKRRDAKPFALMVRDVTAARTLACVSSLEETFLQSSARPIVLLKKIASALPSNIAPNNPSLGIMLPSAPLHYLLLGEGLTALVMTSGNVSGYPIEFTNEGAQARLLTIADGLLLNDRDIHMRVDDSVVRCTEHAELTEPLVSWLRKGRGYAPYPIEITPQVLQPSTVGHSILALGSELKNTVGLLRDKQVYLSQHIGDLKKPEIFYSQQLITQHLAQLYQIKPDILACDAHPAFAKGQAGRDDGLQTVLVQHHHAHMASCMAEHGLSGKTLGVIFDGVGYGADGELWGGEFLYGDYAQVQRVAHLREIPLLGGDKAVHEPIRIAWALAQRAECTEKANEIPGLRRLTSTEQTIFHQMMARNINTFTTSSIGRLFDGVAALLDVCPYAEYEAQGPIALEGLLHRDLTMLPLY